MKSMTGYGKARAEEGGKEVTIELKSVNGRYLDINIRSQKALSFADDIIRKGLQSRLKRGNVEVFVTFEDKSGESRSVYIDMPLASAYIAAAKRLRTEFLLDEDYQLTALLRTPEVVKPEIVATDNALLERLVRSALQSAIDMLEEMRATEGKALQAELTTLVGNVLKLTEAIAVRAPLVVEEYRRRLRERVTEALGAIELDEARLINEVAFFCDKADVREEITRLLSHIDQLTTLIKAKNVEKGRKLDFIMQEINRESNTIGSKSNDVELTNNVIALKNEIEKLREQIRNVE